MKVIHLRCEYLENPLGIDTPRPRLSWQLQSDRQGARQTAYQVVATAGDGTLWDTGRVASSQSVHVEYAGRALRSGQCVQWRVRVWDEEGRPTRYSAAASWEMGLLAREDWRGAWIGGSSAGGPQTSAPCPYLRKPFVVDGPVAAARLYITALGLYEATLNGRAAGADVLAPGWPDFRTRTLYQSYDVTGLLQAGENVLGVILGDGWYCGHVGNVGRQVYGDRPRLLAQLKLVYADGREQWVASDESWQTAVGPLLESDIMMGESYDARLEMAGWDRPGFDASAWEAVRTFPDPGIALVSRPGPAVRRIQELAAVRLPGRRCIFDLGQDMVGRVRLKVRGPAGTTVRLRHAEMLRPDGSLYTENLRTARATDYYTLKGDGEEVYEPRFTFHGFRYVECDGLPCIPGDGTLTGIVLHSDMAPAGEFACSDPLLNQLQHNIQWGQKGNFVEIPTDCPQRDERLGWTGDAQVFARTAAFNMNVAPFFAKWLEDVAAAQNADGQIPPFVPNYDLRIKDGGPAWADALLICPWTVYQCYGDTRLLERLYPAFERFVGHLERTSYKGIRCHPNVTRNAGFGDWLALDGSGRTDGGTPKDLIGTAFLSYSARLLADISGVLGKDPERARYLELAEQVRAAFNRRFVTRDGLVVGRTQTAYVLALHFDLLPERLRPAAVAALVEDIEERDDHLSTGFVGSPYIMPVLARFGRLDVAYRLLLQKSWPSWLYAVTQGATTIWERWDGWTPERGFQDPGMNSFNHYAYGSIGAWLYAVVAGIDVDPAQPGYRHIIFRPQPGGGLTHARAALDSMYGRIISEWRIDVAVFRYDVVVPPNATATVYLPGEAEGHEVGSGTYQYAVAWPCS